MAQVPYNPDNQVAPTDQPIPTRRLDTPFAAFGGTVAAATEHLGQAVSGAGDELFARAMSMQDLYNHSQSLEGATDFSKQAGDIHANLSAMQGKDAVDYYSGQYMSDLNDARQKIRDGLPNDMARKLYDQESMSIMSRTVFNGASHAAQENKNYAIGTAAARVKESQNAALGAPTDEAGFQQHLSDTISNTQAQYQLKGADDDTTNAAIHKNVSDLYISRIQGLAKTHPFQANDILNKAVSDGKIEGEDLGKITSLVQSATRSVGARSISSDIRSGSDLRPGSGVVSIAQAKLGITGAENGGVANYQAQGPEVLAKDGTSRGRALGRYQVMPENLAPWLKEAGLPSMTPAEFLNSPSAQDKVFETKFGQFQTQTGNFNDAASMWFTGKTQAEAGNVTDQTPTSRGHSVPQYLATANRALAQGMSLGDQVSRGRAEAASRDPSDPLLGDFVEQRITSDYHQQLQIKRDDQYNNRQTVESALIGGDQQGNLPTTLDQLKADPKVDAAWNNLEPSEQRRYLGVMAKLDKSDVAMTPERLKEYQRLKGEAQSDPAAFLDEDVVGANLPINIRKELINDQIKKKANAEADPRVTQALQVLRPTLDSAGISRTSDAQGYDQFVGSLQGALEDFNTNNKRPANAKEVGEIGQRLLQSVPGTGWFGSSVGGNKVYNVAVPDAERAKILADPFWAERGITPTDDQVQRVYAGQTYQKLYGGKTKADATPTVPTSK